jgi:hypothetical protein
MRVSKSKQNFLLIAVAALLLTLALPGTALADKKGRGRNSDRRSRKCAKFVNCHDARDGRWDGRGPSGDLDTRAWRSRQRRQRRSSRNDSYNRNNRVYDVSPAYDVRDLKRRNSKKGH